MPIYKFCQTNLTTSYYLLVRYLCTGNFYYQLPHRYHYCVEFKARQKKVDEAFNKNTISQDNVETPSDVPDKDGDLVSCTSPDVNTANDDELEHNNNVFNNDYCNDETMSEQQAAGSGKDEGYKMADSKRPAEEQSLLSANSNDEFAVDLNRILNICDDMEVNYIDNNICFVFY